jgi:hypothetical protein
VVAEMTASLLNLDARAPALSRNHSGHTQLHCPLWPDACGHAYGQNQCRRHASPDRRIKVPRLLNRITDRDTDRTQLPTVVLTAFDRNGSFRYELRQPGLPGSIGLLHTDKSIRRDMQGFSRVRRVYFPSKRGRTRLRTTPHDDVDGEGLFTDSRSGNHSGNFQLQIAIYLT